MSVPPKTLAPGAPNKYVELFTRNTPFQLSIVTQAMFDFAFAASLNSCINSPQLDCVRTPDKHFHNDLVRSNSIVSLRAWEIP
jgi:hypothetical protein